MIDGQKRRKNIIALSFLYSLKAEIIVIKKKVLDNIEIVVKL